VKPHLFLPALTFAASTIFVAGPVAIARDGENIETKIQYYLDHMTIQQKLDYIHGVMGSQLPPFGSATSIAAIPGLGLPEIRTADGTNGLETQTGASTVYPAGLLTVATWNPNLAHSRGIGIGLDARARGVHILAGPGMNTYRVPVGGRNSEYLCGEDPYLGAAMLVPFIQAVQSEGVVATAKHFALNDQEYHRMTVNNVVDERTLREIYLRPFEAAVKLAHVDAFMCAYNKVNGYYSSEQSYLNRIILRRQWKFDGLFMSDWGGGPRRITCGKRWPGSRNARRRSL
jgi:beta-glucosidase